MTKSSSYRVDNPSRGLLRKVIAEGARLAAEIPPAERAAIDRRFAYASEWSRRIERGEIPSLAG